MPAPKDNAECQWRFHVYALGSHAQHDTTQTFQSYPKRTALQRPPRQLNLGYTLTKEEVYAECAR